MPRPTATIVVMHRVPLLLVLGLLLAGPAAPARLGPKRVSTSDPGVAFLKQTLRCSQGLLGRDYPWRDSSSPIRSVPHFLGAKQQCDRIGPRPRFSACDSLHYPLFPFPCFLHGSEVFLRVGRLIRPGRPNLATKRLRASRVIPLLLVVSH